MNYYKRTFMFVLNINGYVDTGLALNHGRGHASLF